MMQAKHHGTFIHLMDEGFDGSCMKLCQRHGSIVPRRNKESREKITHGIFFSRDKVCPVAHNIICRFWNTDPLVKCMILHNEKCGHELCQTCNRTWNLRGIRIEILTTVEIHNDNPRCGEHAMEIRKRSPHVLCQDGRSYINRERDMLRKFSCPPHGENPHKEYRQNRCVHWIGV